MNDLRALGWITASIVRRLLREPQVVRSLLWPIALGPITLVATVLVWVWVQGDWPIAVDDSTPAEVVELLQTEGFVVVEEEHARTQVATGRYNLGTDGLHVWTSGDRGVSLELERVLRQRVGAKWMAGVPIDPTYDPSAGARVTGVLGFLFVLFGVVFGAGMVARDRDDGTLEAELALGVRHWVHGAARWIGGTFVLSIHFLLAIAVIHALMGIEDRFELARHGVSACSTAVAIGLLVIGRGGLKAGFSGPLAAGITGATALAAYGIGSAPGAHHLPIASLIAGGNGWTSGCVSLGIGALAIALFTFRSARA